VLPFTFNRSCALIDEMVKAGYYSKKKADARKKALAAKLKKIYKKK